MFKPVYEEVFFYEWIRTDIPFLRQHPVPLIHEAIKLDAGFRAGVILNNSVILELKSVDALAKVYFKQVMTYLKLMNLKLGLLINFNIDLLKEGVHRIADPS